MPKNIKKNNRININHKVHNSNTNNHIKPTFVPVHPRRSVLHISRIWFDNMDNTRRVEQPAEIVNKKQI